MRFSERADVEPIFQDVRNGIVRNVSVGYSIQELDRIPPTRDGDLWTYRAVRWQPFELSLVAVGADAGAGVRSAGGNPEGNSGAPVNACVFNDFHHPADSANRSEEGHMAKEEKAENKTAETKEETRQPAAQQPDQAAIEAARADGRRLEAERQALIRKASRTMPLGDEFVRGLMEDTSLTLDQVRERVFDEAARFSESTQGRAVAITTERDEQDVRRQAIADSVAHRANPSLQLPEAARRYRGMSLLEAARRSLEEQGVRTDGMSRMQIAGLALGNSDEHGFRALHGTSDFAIALANTAARTLRSAYESAPRTFTAWARRGTLADFRAATRVAIAANLSLEKVHEHGEFKRGKIVDAGESIQLATYGKVIGITRQAIINDDLDMFGRIPAMYGRAAADFESDTVYSILTANAALSDGVALFHANHGNLGTAGAPSETTFAEMRKLARLQKDPSGNGQPLNLTIRHVIVPAALETTAQKILQAVIVATKSADTNPFNGAYQLIVE
ncbi:MAG TPA: Mu-like prophage major head subunit gpT family protein, partial [Burkholderiaceae bacterium]|nr:Mu-like prophage major head subunit gpT family protein [Burkholderiaceae bacterium]